MTSKNAAPTRIIAAAVMMIGACLAGCGGGDPRTFERSHIAPSRTQQPAAAEQLNDASLTHDEVSVRYQAVDEIGDIGGEEAIFVLQQALLDPEPDIREAAIDALADIGSDESVAALAYALNDDDVLLREAAVHGLGQIGGPAATGLLRDASMDPDARVRIAAHEMLMELASDAIDEAGSRD